MSDIDALIKTAEGRIARSGRSALSRARAEGRLARLVDATAASAAESAPASGTSRTPWWLASGGAAILAGAVLTSAVTRTSPAAPPVVSAPPVAPPLETALPPARAIVSVDNLPNAPEEATTPVKPQTASVRTAAVTRPPVRPAAEDAVPEGPTLARPTSTSESASSLFERANGARRGADYVAAEDLYRRLLERYPSSREAATARIVLGRMLLSQGEPDAALALFDRYLADAPRGPLAEQALVGRAQCLSRLGRRDEERLAWRSLLETFPGSPSRTEALERLR